MRWLDAIGNFFYEILFGCHHGRLTRPFTIEQQTYKVCLDCGKQIFYSAEKMAPLSSREIRHLKTSHLGELKIIPSRGWQQNPAPVTISSDNGNAAA
jgi:hypothetical protein